MSSHSPADLPEWVKDLVKAAVRRTMAQEYDDGGSYVDPDDLDAHLDLEAAAELARWGKWRPRKPKAYLKTALNNSAKRHCADMRIQARPGTPPLYALRPEQLAGWGQTMWSLRQARYDPARGPAPLEHDGAAEAAFYRYGLDPDLIDDTIRRIPDKDRAMLAALADTPYSAIAERFDTKETTARRRVRRLLEHLADRVGRDRSSVGEKLELPDGRKAPRVVPSGMRESTEQVEHQAGFRPNSRKPFTQAHQSVEEAVRWGFDARPAAVEEPKEAPGVLYAS